MHFLYVLCLAVLATAQYELLTLSDLSGSTSNPTEIDYCATNTHACAVACVNGTYPQYGYTCRNANGTRFEVDASAQELFVEAKSLTAGILKEKFVSIEDVEYNTMIGTATYVFGLNGSLSTSEMYFVSLAPTLIAAQFGSVIQINPSRIIVSSVASTITITLLLPAVVIIQWNSSEVGSIIDLRTGIFAYLKVNDSIPANAAMEVNGYFENNSTVWVTFVEALSANQGADPLLKPRACAFMKYLFTDAGQAMVSTAGYTIQLSTVTTTDKQCQYVSVPAPVPEVESNLYNSSTIVAGWLWLVGVVVMAVVKNLC